MKTNSKTIPRSERPQLQFVRNTWVNLNGACDEYGGIKRDVNSGPEKAWGYGNAPRTEEEFLDRFKGLAEALLFNPYITGFCYTQLTDVEQETKQFVHL